MKYYADIKQILLVKKDTYIHMYILNAHVCLWIYSTKIKAGVNLLYKGGHCSIICNDKDKNILIKMSINERLVK